MQRKQKTKYHSFKTAAKRCCLFGVVLCFLTAPAYGAEEQKSLLQAYEGCQQRLNGIKWSKDIKDSGFMVIDAHVFPVTLQNFGDVTFIPAMDKEYGRLALFLADADGRIVYRTDQLETNYQKRGELKQPNKGIAAVSFQDVNGDLLTDIILITSCVKETGDYAGQMYKVGDVIFQTKPSAAGSLNKADTPKIKLYRDYRVSGKINQYSMNKSVKFITSHVRDGYSTEFLYTSTTLDRLLNQGFKIIPEQSYWYKFEKMGKLRVVSGTYRMAEYSVFMVYLVNEQGYIVWSFQPMGNYENLYELRGVASEDIDGDGLVDIVVLANYSTEGEQGEMVVESDYSIYYQRNGGFSVDTEFKSGYAHSAEDTITQLIETARLHWGWR